MARNRSPNYPLISLPEAIELARLVHQKEHTHKMAPEVVAKAIGYKGLNGKTLGLISALKKYGLLEEVGKDLKITEAALTILVDPQDSPSRAAAIRAAAFMPALFGELQKQYGESLPSDENIRSYLLKHGFTLTAVDTPIRAYRETMELVTSQSKDYNIVEGNKPLNTSEIAAERVAREVGNLPPKVKGKQIGVLPIAADSSITISADGDVTQEGLDRLIDYIKLIKPSFPKTWL